MPTQNSLNLGSGSHYKENASHPEVGDNDVRLMARITAFCEDVQGKEYDLRDVLAWSLLYRYTLTSAKINPSRV